MTEAMKIRLPVKMSQALDLAAEREANDTTVAQVIRRAIDFYLTERHGINYRQINRIIEEKNWQPVAPNSSGG